MSYSSCTYEKYILEYLQEELSTLKKKDVESHIDSCFFCQITLQEMRENIEILQQFSSPHISRNMSPEILASLPSQRSILMPSLLAFFLVFSLWIGFQKYSQTNSPSLLYIPQKKLQLATLDLPFFAKEWLKNTQSNDGSWQIEKWGGQKKYIFPVTCLALLVFLKDSKNSFQGLYEKNLQKGMNYLIRNQKKNGLLGIEEDYSLEGHLLATIVLSKIQKQKPSPTLNKSLLDARKYIKTLQKKSVSSPEKYQFLQNLPSSFFMQVETFLSSRDQLRGQWKLAGGKVYSESVALLLFP